MEREKKTVKQMAPMSGRRAGRSLRRFILEWRVARLSESGAMEVTRTQEV